VTLELEHTEWHVGELLAALGTFERPITFTLPNADPCGRLILRRLKEFVQTHPKAHLVENMGTQRYFSLMALAAAMIGNSSSGIIEAPSFGLPVVNIGTRQQGRLRAANVIDVGYKREAIVQGIHAALKPQFRARLSGLANPYGDGHAAERIVARLKEVPLDHRLIRKRFVDLPPARSPAGEPQEVLRVAA
jgi:UDP-hydrolysing UDP-N-acetyl-D-glucosamine 2-epimerase